MKFILPLFWLLLVLAADNAFAQTGKANRLYEQNKFALALQEYKKAADKGKLSLETTQRIATSYRLINNSNEAENWYARVLAFPEAEPRNILFYAQALQNNGKYEEAKKQYQLYLGKTPAEADRLNKLIAGTEQARQWLKQPERVKIMPATELNSTAAEFSPVAYKNGILFTSDRPVAGNINPDPIYGWTGRPYLRLFYSEFKKDKSLKSPVPFDSVISEKQHKGPAALSDNSQLLFFTQSKIVEEKQRVQGDPTRWTPNSKPNLVNRFEIFWAEQKNGSWSKPEPFPYNNPSEYSVGHPALSADGKVLYFASDMPGGKGQTDIYYVSRQTDGSWSKPLNAGPEINTPERESFPVLAPDGTLYFASDGHIGMGGLDLFSAKGSKNTWNNIQNLKAPLNSSKDDFGIVFDKNKQSGYLSSSRLAMDGTDDIFKFEILQKPVYLVVTTSEKSQANRRGSTTAALANVRLALNQLARKDSVVSITNSKGRSTFELSQNLNYSLKGTKAGYLTRTVSVSPTKTAPGDTLRINLIFNKSQVEQAIVLDNIYYDLDKWEIRPDAARELNELVQILKDNPRIKIEMSAHTDSREGEGYNLRLSQRRAQAAVDYLITNGIASSRLKAKGYGKTRLLNRCKDGVSCSEEEHQLNRRTEFKILK